MTSAAATPLKLIADREHERAFACLLLSRFIGLPKVDLISGAAASPGSGSSAATYPHLKIGDNRVIQSQYAICKWMQTYAKQQELDCPLFVNVHESGDPHLTALCEDIMFWVTGPLRTAVRGMNQKSLHNSLRSLESLFLPSSGCSAEEAGSLRFVVKEKITLADIFAYSTLRLSRLHTSEMLNKFGKIQAFIRSMESIPEVQETLRQCLPPSTTLGVIPLHSPVTSDAPMEKFYVTTAINYTNGLPHIGHAYEIVMTDILARYHRSYGRKVLFCTGTDEHGQKIATAAEKAKMAPIDLCTMYASKFQELNARLNISNDIYIRTTMPEHHKVAQHLWKLSKAKGDIYLGKYNGWYSVREEAFVTERDAEAMGYKDSITGLPLQKMEEESYFFRMSKYQEQLVDHIKTNKHFISPEIRRNEILARLSEKLEDLSLSRTTFKWGIPVPDDSDHVMYVWFDALVNYLTAVWDFQTMTPGSFWPANVHIIGKDIIWFHCVIWPCMLLSMGIPLPDAVFGHGFVSAADGRKMSKSLGNVVDPSKLLEAYSSDTLRFFFSVETPFGNDLRFDLDSLIDHHNSNLADTLGNLVRRCTTLCVKDCQGVVPDVPLPDGEAPFDLSALKAVVEEAMKSFDVQAAVEAIWSACRDVNRFLTVQAPWTIADVEERQGVIRCLLEAVYVLAHFMEPIVPTASEEVFKQLNTPRTQIRSLSPWFDNLKPGTPVSVGAILFSKVPPRQAQVPIQRFELRVCEVQSVNKVVGGLGHTLLLKCSNFGEASDFKSLPVPRLADEAVPQLPGKKIVVLWNIRLGDSSAAPVVLCAVGVNQKSFPLEVANAGEQLEIGGLIEADGYQPVLKNREAVIRKDLDALKIEKTQEGAILCDGLRLVVGKGGPGIVCPYDAVKPGKQKLVVCHK